MSGFDTFSGPFDFGCDAASIITLDALIKSAQGLNANNATNNGPTQNQKYHECLDKINDTPDGKFYNFFSYLSPFIGPDAGWGEFGTDAAKEAAQEGTKKFFKAAAQNWTRTPLGSLGGFVSETLETLDAAVLIPISGAATAGQLTVHAGCLITSLF